MVIVVCFLAFLVWIVWPEEEPGNAFPPTGIHDKASTRPTKGRIPERTSVNEKDC